MHEKLNQTSLIMNHENKFQNEVDMNWSKKLNMQKWAQMNIKNEEDNKNLTQQMKNKSSQRNGRIGMMMENK